MTIKRTRSITWGGIGQVASSSMTVGDGGGISIVSLTSIEEGLVIKVDLRFFGRFGENVTFFLVTKGGVVDDYNWIDWPSQEGGWDLNLNAFTILCLACSTTAT